MLGLGLNINKYNTGLSPNLLLDKFPDAAAAYSLRALSKNWVAQPVVRVRRDIDDTERDFTAKEVADGTMESWVNWYDETLPADHGSGAAAAYSLREVSAAWAGQPVVRVRRESDDAEADFTAAEVEDGTMLNWVFGVTDETLPADHGSGAAAAYSLRYVAAAYEAAGSPVVRVRRSSNNSEMDFTPTQIEDGTLVTWVGVGNDGFVTTWYDQSGNERNSIQVNAGQQPEIVRTGSLVSVGKKRGVYFDLGQRIVNNFPLETQISVFSTVEKTTSGIITRMIHGGSEDIFYLYWNTTTEIAVTAGGQYTIGSNDWIGTRIYSLHAVSGDNQIFINSESAVISSDIGSKTPNGLVIGDIRLKNNPVAGNYNWQDGIAEVIIYSEDARAYGSAIESNTNRYYGIYDANAYVVKWYDQSGNGNDLSQPNAINQAKIIDSGVLVARNGRVGLQFDETVGNWYENDFTVTITNEYFQLAVASAETSSLYTTLIPSNIQTTMQGYLGTRVSGGKWGTFDSIEQIFGDISTLDIVSRSKKTGLVKTDVNGTKGVEYASSKQVLINALGTFTTTSGFFNGVVCEVIMYNSSQESNWDNIETNTRQYYNVYQQNGYVVKWYDQSGNGRDAEQTTAANQPKIIDSGVLQAGVKFGETMNTKLSLIYRIFDPVTLYAAFSTLVETPFPYIVGNSVGSTGDFMLLGFVNSTDVIRAFGPPGVFMTYNIGSFLGEFLTTTVFDSVNSELKINGSQVATGILSGTSVRAELNIGSNNKAGAEFSGLLYEIVLYENNMNSNDIETNINNHYNIY